MSQNISICGYDFKVLMRLSKTESCLQLYLFSLSATSQLPIK